MPTTAADSGVVEDVPTSIPSDTKSRGPTSRNGRTPSERVMWAPKSRIPVATIRQNEIRVMRMYQSIFEASHSVFVSGVSERALKTLSRL